MERWRGCSALRRFSPTFPTTCPREIRLGSLVNPALVVTYVQRRAARMCVRIKPLYTLYRSVIRHKIRRCISSAISSGLQAPGAYDLACPAALCNPSLIRLIRESSFRSCLFSFSRFFCTPFLQTWLHSARLIDQMFLYCYKWNFCKVKENENK